MNLPVQHNGALGAFCPCDTCNTCNTCNAFLGDLITPIPTTSHARDPLEHAMLEEGLLSPGFDQADRVEAMAGLNPRACGADADGSFGYGAIAGAPDWVNRASVEEAYESPLTVVEDPLRFMGVDVGDSDEQVSMPVAEYLAMAAPRLAAEDRALRPAQVIDLDAARRQAMPRENREHVADMLLFGGELDGAGLDVYEHRNPVHLGTFRGQVAPEPPPMNKAKLLFWILCAIFVLLLAMAVRAPGGGQ